MRSFFSDLAKSFKIYSKKYPIKTLVFSLIGFFHVFFILFGAFAKPNIKISKQKKLAIKTYQLEKETKVVSSTISQSKKVSKKAAPRKKIIPVRKKTKKAPRAKVSSQPRKKKISQTKKLLQEVQESIAKIETNKDNYLPNKSMSIPKPIGELKTSSFSVSSEETTEKSLEYHQLLTKVLKDHLMLPAYGKVKLKLTVSNSGLIKKLETLYSDSEVNRLYLEKHLPSLDLPEFSNDLSGLSEYCFSLVFCSDENS